MRLSEKGYTGKIARCQPAKGSVKSSEERYRPEMLKEVEQFDVATSQSILQIYHFAKEEYA